MHELNCDRAEVIMLTIPCIILFRISCNSSALCPNFHMLFSKLFSRSLSKQFRSSQNDTYAKYDYSIRVIIQPTS